MRESVELKASEAVEIEDVAPESIRLSPLLRESMRRAPRRARRGLTHREIRRASRRQLD